MDLSTKLMSVEIPPSLRPISFFLYEAQKSMRQLQNSTNPFFQASCKKIIVHAITHAFKLLAIVETHVDDGAQTCLDDFRSIREQHALDLDMDVSDSNSFMYPSLRIVVAHAEDILIAEANELLALAQEQLEENLTVDASRNFHAAAVYYRVLESIVPSTNTLIHEHLKTSAALIRQTSTLTQNFVQEHFSGSSCSEYYDIHGKDKLGKGSYGSVYLATHRITGDKRAVKVMNVDRVTSYYLRKLHTEIAILREVNHPNIIKLQDVFFGRRSVYLVTDLCKGGELYELLTTGKTQGFVFREDRAARLMQDMFSSVKYLHSKGIVHRDLKLENFLFEGESSSSPLILIDFGLSKHFDATEKMHQRVGSCYYTAPEVLVGSYDYRCDVWSLGVICYMLLSGSPPFHGKTSEDIHSSIVANEAEYPERRFKHVSPIGIDFMRRLLVKDPMLRMTSAEALTHPFIVGLPIPAGIQQRQENLLNNADEILRSIRMFSSLEVWVKIILFVVAYTLPVDQIHHLREEFYALDINHNGTLSLSEIQNLSHQDDTYKIEQIFQGLCLPLPTRSISLASHSSANMSIAISDIEVNMSRSGSSIDGTSDPPVSVPSTPVKINNQIELQFSEYIAASMCTRIEVLVGRVECIFDRLDTCKLGIFNADIMAKAFGVNIDVSAVRESIMRSKLILTGWQAVQAPPHDNVDRSCFSILWKEFFENIVQNNFSYNLSDEESAIFS